MKPASKQKLAGNKARFKNQEFKRKNDSQGGNWKSYHHFLCWVYVNGCVCFVFRRCSLRAMNLSQWFIELQKVQEHLKFCANFIMNWIFWHEGSITFFIRARKESYAPKRSKTSEIQHVIKFKLIFRVGVPLGNATRLSSVCQTRYGTKMPSK